MSLHCKSKIRNPKMKQIIANITQPLRIVAPVCVGSLLFTGCVPDPYWDDDYFSTSFSYSSGGYGGYMYDTAGFPIYGYYGGRPVYGYTPAGSPIYSINLLYSGCYVPSWGPAPHYRGPHRWPSGIRRLERPRPHWNHGRMPVYNHRRPDRPINNHRPVPPKNWHGNDPRPNNRPVVHRPDDKRPSFNHRPGDRPSLGRPSPNRPSDRPSLGRPSFDHKKPQPLRPSVIRPGSGSPNLSVSNRPSRPSMNPSSPGRPSMGRPQPGSPSPSARPSSPGKPSMSSPPRRPSAPSGSHSRPSSPPSHRLPKPV